MYSTQKMSWFIDAYNSNTMPTYIHDTKENFGTICMPTGTGKSGVVFADIIKKYTCISKNKIIINISTPILKLNQQFIKDLFEVLSGIYKNHENELMFFVNSSDSGISYNEYVKDMNISVNNFKPDIFNRRFVNNHMAKIAIITSCHKSLPKFISYISHKDNQSLIKNVDIVTYIDESHLITMKKHTDNQGELDMTRVNLNLLCKHSTSVYALSATPSAEVTQALNAWNSFGKKSNAFIYKLSPIDAIGKGLILPPYVHYVKTKTDGINAEMLLSIMKDACRQNNNINHKILVTLNSAEELISIRKDLEQYTYKVFSTCHKYGFGKDEQITDEYKITDFINDIETYDGNCFVLHIHQMVQGIDIKSLTDCVIWSNSNANVKSYRHIIQIIGRTIRTPERNVPKDQRIKKYGGVYFITTKDDDKIQKNLGQFIVRYYGIDNVIFDEVKCRYPGSLEDDLWSNDNDMFSKSGWDHAGISELRVKMQEDIQKMICYLKARQETLGIYIDIQSEIDNIAKQYSAFNQDCDTYCLLEDNTDMVKEVEMLFNKYYYATAE